MNRISWSMVWGKRNEVTCEEVTYRVASDGGEGKKKIANHYVNALNQFSTPNSGHVESNLFAIICKVEKGGESDEYYISTHFRRRFKVKVKPSFSFMRRGRS